MFVILSVAKNLFFELPRFFTPLRSVQNDRDIQCFLTATSSNMRLFVAAGANLRPHRRDASPTGLTAIEANVPRTGATLFTEAKDRGAGVQVLSPSSSTRRSAKARMKSLWTRVA